jgi:hypothetical protein
MAADHLVRDGPSHRREVEAPHFLGHPGVIDDLKQQIAQFIGQTVEIAPFDRIGDLVGLFDRIGSDRGEALLLVPRTAVIRVAQRRHDVQQATKLGFRGLRGRFRCHRFAA